MCVKMYNSYLQLYLRLMGLPREAYWFGWILNELIVQLPVLIIQTSLIFYEFDSNTGSLVRQGSFTLWFTLLFLYLLASLSFMTFVASFFKRGMVSLS